MSSAIVSDLRPHIVDGLDYHGATRQVWLRHREFHDFLSVAPGRLAASLGCVIGSEIPAAITSTQARARRFARSRKTAPQRPPMSFTS